MPEVTVERSTLMREIVAAAPAAAAEIFARDPNVLAALDDAWQQAKLQWPCALSSETFAAYVGARLAADGDAEAIARVAVADLRLACACVHDIPGAHARLRERHVGDVRRGLGHQPDPATLDELIHDVFHHLLVCDRDRPPRIAEYSGRGSLGRWLSVVARRVALDRARAGRRQIEAFDDGGIAAAYGDPELAAMNKGTHDAFRAALEEAAAALAPRDRNMLRYVFVHHLGIDEIAGIYRISRSTAYRKLNAVRDGLVAHVRERMRERLGLAAAELDPELARMLSNVAVTFSRILKAPRS